MLNYQMKRRLDGSAIRKLRKEKGLTLKDLDALSGVSYQAISDIERGMQPTKKAAYALSKALEFSPLEWRWNIPAIAENLKDLGVEEDRIPDFLVQLEMDEWSDLERW